MIQYKQLHFLHNTFHAVVKGYASWALADKKYNALGKILIQFLDSKEMVRSVNGCIHSKNELASEFYYRVLYQDYDNPLSKKDSLFYVKEVKKLDSIILYYPKNTSLLDLALEHNKANPQTYKRVRELALQAKNSKAIVELAKYEKTDAVIALGLPAPAIVWATADSTGADSEQKINAAGRQPRRGPPRPFGFCFCQAVIFL